MSLSCRAIAAAAAIAITISLRALTGTSEGSPDGAKVFETQCRACHDGSDARAPSLEALRGRGPKAIVDALTSGSMRYQGLPLSGAERRAVAEFISGRKLRGTIAGTAQGRCARPTPLGNPLAGPRWLGWSPDLENTHFQPADQAGLTREQVPRLQLKWAFGFADTTSAWAQPTVVDGRLFIGSQNGLVYSLNAATGCIVWTFSARAGVRTSVTIAGRGRRLAYFGDQNGRVYAVDAATGREVWSRQADDHPFARLTGSPVLFEGRLYVPLSSYEERGRSPGVSCCTFRGGVIALDASTGATIWRAYTIDRAPALMRSYADGSELWGPAGGAVWSAPTIDARRGALYVGTGNTYAGAAQPTTDAIVAIDLKTGERRWARQMSPGERDVFGCRPGEVNCGANAGPDFDFGASPILVRRRDGRELVIAAQKSGVVYALDPDRKGEAVWRYRAGGGSGLGGIEWGIASDATQVYLPVADIYSDTPGGLHAVRIESGTRAWMTPAPPPICGQRSRGCNGAQFSAVTATPGVVFSSSNDGGLRAYAADTGEVIWTFDTNREFATVNGVRARGGSMDGPAPVVAGAMLYISSGYGTFGLRPGNVLLALTPK